MNVADLRSVPAATPTRPSGAPTASGQSRDPALDLLRSVALVRVVLWHAFAATWMMAFAAMPVMFFVAGTLLPGRAAVAETVRTLLRRARRILVPLWIYAGTVAAVLAIAGVRPGWGDVRGFLWWVVPLGDPPAADFHAGWLSNHLWYLRAYLWLLLLSPVLHVLARRVRLSLVGATLLVAVLDWVPSWSWRVPVVASGAGRIIIGDGVAYGLFAVLGLAYGQHRRAARAPGAVVAPIPGLPRWAMALLSATCAAATIVFATVRGLPTGGINASYPAIVLCGMAWLFGVGSMEAPLRRLAARPALATRSRAVSSRALTIYLWHPAAIVVARSQIAGDGVVSWIAITAVTAALTALAVVGVGWVEDLAARRHPRMPHLPAPHVHVPHLPMPRVRRPAAPLRRWRHVVSNAAFLMAAVIGLTTCMPSLVPSGAVTGVAAGTAGSAARPEILPPSFRDALGDDAFSAPPSSDASGPAAAEPTTATEVSTSTATTPETSVAGPAVASGPGATGSVADPTGLQDLPAGPPDPAASDRGATVPSLDLNLESARPLLPMAPARAVALRAALDAWHLGRPTVGSVAVSVAAGGERWHGASGPVAVPGAAASGAASGAPPGVAPGASAGVSPPAFGVGDPFPIASLTKTFTLALVLREVERGTIDLDAPVPPLPGIGELNERLGITPRQLLQHASGLVNYTNADEFTVTELTPADAVAISMRTPLRSAPGTKVYYANTNYLYLGLLVEHVTGRRYPELVADMIERIRLAQSAVDVVRGKGWVGFSSGGMSSSLPDLAAWLEALYSPGVILAPESIQMISALTDLRLALGMWPICPCWTDPTTGERGYTAIGHQAEFGAINRYPKAGISVAVRIDPPSPEAGALAADLGRALAAALASPAVPLSSPA